MSMFKDLLKALGSGSFGGAKGPGVASKAASDMLGSGFNTGAVFGNESLLKNVAKSGLSKSGPGLLEKLTKAHGIASAAYNFKESDSLYGKGSSFLRLLGGLGKQANEYVTNPEKLIGKNNPFSTKDKEKWLQMNWMR